MRDRSLMNGLSVIHSILQRTNADELVFSQGALYVTAQPAVGFQQL